ncbi:MAG: precorrin-6Y C5,15-methyltransferase (decarboxylating) subunit CbiT [Candidatus Nitrosotalea sp.]|nr:precorrin-6Y C5,15-methyltransferase (decarboxylating) subunit CbiT [Candidatus Nitrosotalea sp.]
MWQHRTPGIPDELFDRVEDVPITKEEVRVIQVSKARLSSGQVVYDVGCGSGSISVEAAHQVGPSGKVFSIDIDQNAVDLTKKNLEKFHVSNVSVILGNATQKISELPMADAIFIGGTGGETADIVKLCESKLKQGGRIVIGTILVETLYSVLSTIEKLQFSSVDIIQVTISKSKKTSTGTMFLARNPVTIISATRI